MITHEPTHRGRAVPTAGPVDSRRRHGEAARRPVGNAAVILVYRGSWCPYCAAQLASFARAYDTLTGAGIRVVVVSADSRTDAEATVAEHKLPFPVAHGVDPHELAELIGNFVGTDLPRPYAQSTSVLLDDQGRVLIAVYSSGAIGRLTPADVLGYLAHLREDDQS